MTVSSYLTALDLGRNPFPVAPDDDSFFVSAHIEQVITEIVHGIESRKGFMVLSGDVGLGKTTITRRILGILAEKKVHTSLVFHTSLQDAALLKEINRDFGLPTSTGSTDDNQLGDQLQQLYEYLTAKYHQGENCAIIIDDAQNLDRNSLELVRMISNLEADRQKLVQILLVGQPELMTTLTTPELRQLRSRIMIGKTVRPLSRDELRTYIVFKLSLAGNQGRITITQEAFGRLYGATRGNFRQLNVLMDRCLYVLCGDDCRQITSRIVKAAQADLNPATRLRGKRAMAMAASIVLPLMLGLMAWGAHLYTSRTAEAVSMPSERYYKVATTQSVPVHGNDLVGVKADASMGKSPQPVPQANPAVADFLAAHQLYEYTLDFSQALKEGGLPHLAERIYRESGYQLVELSSVSQDLRRRYGALAISPAPGQTPNWLLFWRPQMTLKRFYYRYKGEEIYQLQQMLAAAELYHHDLDGIVGTRLMKAVIDFQTRWGLPVTGFPDSTTLFLLYHQLEA